MAKFDTSPNQEKINDPFLQILWGDMVEAERLLEGEDSQFGRRVFLRAAFAYIEGHIFWLKGKVLQILISKQSEKGTINFSQISALLDDVPRVERTGKIKLEKNRLPFLNHVALVLRTAAELFTADPQDFFSSPGWQSIQRALKLRHEITHPKCPDKLHVSESQMQEVRDSIDWILDSTHSVFEQSVKDPDGIID